MAFAEKLIAIRRAHYLTQEQLAAKLFVTRQAVSRWERDEVTPGIDIMKLIAAVTGDASAVKNAVLTAREVGLQLLISMGSYPEVPGIPYL